MRNRAQENFLISHFTLQYYDKVAELTGCSGNGSLACLRKVPTANLTAAIDQTPSLFAYQSYVPHPISSMLQ